MDVTISWVSPHDAASIAPALRDLLAELSPSSAQLEVDAIVDRLGDDRLRVAIAVADGQLVGSASLTLLVTLADGLVGRVEDVVVCAAARGGGVGRKLMDALHDEARQLDVAHLDLTSRPSREPANAMYLSLGYEHRETNVYRWRLHA